MELTRNGSRPSAKGPAEHFTGNVRVDPLFQASAPGRTGAAYVTFEPCARSDWHTHPLGQSLIVTFGRGLHQRWGGPVEEIGPGDVVTVGAIEKHWHGASPTAAMTHIAIQESLGESRSNGSRRSPTSSTRARRKEDTEMDERKARDKSVIVVIGAGSIGQAIARRVSAGKHVLLADLRQENAEAAAAVLTNAGFEVSTATVDVSSRDSIHKLVEAATAVGEVTGVIHAAGVSPSQASPKTILAVDLYGTAVVLEEFGNVIANGGAGVVIASQSGHRLGALTAEQDKALATTPADELLALPMLQPDKVQDSLHAYQLAKRGNSLRVMAEAVRWGKRGARVNTISPGIIITPLAKDELTGPRGEGYRRMIELCPTGRAGTPDEVGNVGALLMGADGAFITGSDFLMDGGVTASYWFGELAPK